MYSAWYPLKKIPYSLRYFIIPFRGIPVVSVRGSEGGVAQAVGSTFARAYQDVPVY